MKHKYFIVILMVLISYVVFYFFHQTTWQADEFANLPHWEQQNHQKSLEAFIRSCPEMIKKSSFINLCEQAKKTTEAKQFFETYFTPYKLKMHPQAFFTGYYSPFFTGSVVKKSPFNFPIYARPQDLIQFNLQSLVKELPAKQIYAKLFRNTLVPFDNRQQIYQGSLIHRAKVIVWVRNPLDALELEIEGAGVIQTAQEKIYLNYDGENGHPYQAIGKFLIQDNKLTPKKLNMITIRHYFDKHPSELIPYLIKNPSYVFFKRSQKPIFLGYRNIPLKAGYSAAVDKHFIPIGTPVFVSFNLPSHLPFNRLMVAQDVGGAIKGLGRVDIYFGSSQKAQKIARQLKSKGDLWVLQPKF